VCGSVRIRLSRPDSFFCAYHLLLKMKENSLPAAFVGCSSFILFIFFFAITLLVVCVLLDVITLKRQALVRFFKTTATNHEPTEQVAKTIELVQHQEVNDQFDANTKRDEFLFNLHDTVFWMSLPETDCDGCNGLTDVRGTHSSPKPKLGHCRSIKIQLSQRTDDCHFVA
jgi:hypothetical protein